jgi:hypothetical protein
LTDSSSTHFDDISRTHQRRLLETVLSNCTFDRGSLSPTYNSPFDLLVQGNETGDWRGVWDDFRNWILKIA